MYADRDAVEYDCDVRVAVDVVDAADSDIIVELLDAGVGGEGAHRRHDEVGAAAAENGRPGGVPQPAQLGQGPAAGLVEVGSPADAAGPCWGVRPEGREGQRDAAFFADEGADLIVVGQLPDNL